MSLNNWVIAIWDTFMCINPKWATISEQTIYSHLPFLWVIKLTMKAYHAQTNGQVELYTCTLVVGLHHYVFEDQRDRDTHLKPLLYSYNTKTRREIGPFLLILILSRDPPFDATLGCLAGSALDMPKDAQSWHINQMLLECVEIMMKEVRRRMAATQKRYKND